MHSYPRIVITRLLLAGLCMPLVASAQISVRGLKVLGSKDAVEIEVEASDRVVPQTRVLTGPDRLVIDFPNAVPGAELRNQSVDRGEVKDVRFGLFQSKPPVTRIVLDLKAAQSYQVFPYGRTTIIKITGNAPDGANDSASATSSATSSATPGHASLVTANYTPGAVQVQAAQVAPAPPAEKPLDVTFQDGLLGIKSNKATLSEVLSAVQQRTGAEVSIAPGAEQEQVVVDIPPAPAPEVLAQLLHGSKFNFLILSSPNDPRQLDRVILSPRADGGPTPLSQVQNNDAQEDAPPPAQPQPANPAIANRPPDANNPPEDNAPDQ